MSDLAALDIDKIYQAFSPAQEIRNPELFVGRREEMEKGISALMNRGGFLAIYGLRGVGKSSIGYQLKLIAEGDYTLPEMISLDHLIPRSGFEYKVHYIRCDSFINNIVDLIERILFGDDENPSLFSLTKTGDRRIKEIKNTIRGEAGGEFFGISAKGEGSRQTTYQPRASENLIQKFREVIRLVQKDIHAVNNGLLILIDEFDTIENKEGFASLVKACSSDFVKFGVIGIATSVGELVKDHNSIGRQFDIIPVNTMPEIELSKILQKAEYVVDRKITFSKEASNAITSLSEGFPFFTHLLGKESMLSAFKRKSSTVEGDHIDVLQEKISNGRLDTIYEDMYHSAVKSSEQREMLLKIFAEKEDDEIHTEGVYKLAKEMGITNPSQLMKELTSSERGSPVLRKVRPRYYRFTDPVFKAYARMRGWKFDQSEA